MAKKLFLLFLISLFYISGSAQSKHAFLWGKHPDYKNAIIKSYAYADYISRSIEVLSVDTVDDSGAFLLTIPILETRQIIVDLGLFQGVLYLESGDSCEVVLPDYSPKTMAEILNPFFQPTQIYLGIRNIQSDNLNYRIADFDEHYNHFIDSNYVQLFKKPRKREIDSLVELLEMTYDSIDHDYFKTYRTYKYAWLQYVSYKRDYRYIVRDFFNNKPTAYYNIPFMDLFNQLFTNYFSFYQNTAEGERLYSDIAYAKSPKYMAETFENNMVLFNDTLQELVMLKGIHDAYYSFDYPSASLTITLDSIALLTKVDYHREIANNIKEKVFKTKAGQPAPQFELLSSTGDIKQNSDYLSKYVYLNFCSVESFTCQQDFELIKNLAEKYKDDLLVVSISIDADFEMASNYFVENNYQWDLLSYNAYKEIIDDYNVRAYPTYYLLSPDGNLKMSPAVGPTENFEYYLFKALQAKERGVKP